MKAKLFDANNLLISLKALASSIVAGLCTIPIWALGTIAVKNGFYAVGGLLGITTLIFGWLFFGYFSRKWWVWK